MLLKLLDTRRDDVDLEMIGDYWALFRGGKAFRARIDRFLPKRPSEADNTWAFRKKNAHYLNYAGPIISYLAALVFSEQPEITAKPDADPWYAELQDDCDGNGTDLLDLLRARFTRALVTKRAWLLVDFPQAPEDLSVTSRADWEANNLGRAFLCPFDDEQVVDWEVDDRSQLEWALVHQVDKRRRSLAEARGGVTVETWTHWTREKWERFELKYEDGKRPKETEDVQKIAEGPVATKGRVPLIRIELPDELWAMNELYEPQLEQARKRNSLSWGMDASCYPRLVYKLEESPNEEEEDGAGGRGPAAGWGRADVLGTEEDAVWIAPPTNAYEVIAAYIANLKDEIYRVVHQMALGVENNAAAVGRSADSKAEDSSATTVVARAIGKCVRETLKQIFDLVSLGRGDETEWSVKGMDKYVKADLATAIDAAVKFDTVNVPSPTARRESAKRVTFTYLNDLAPKVREQISKEIDQNITDEDASQPVTKTKTPTPADEDPEDEDEDGEKTDGAED